jgi:tRNA dimethylallyltransferase
MPKNKPLIVIVGETATGKTQLSLNLARLFNGEIICCDSRTIYKDMIIGTASPSQDERRIVKHHLLNVIDPLRPISAAEFKQLCTQAIKKIQDNSKIPFLVGGSGLYIDSVIYNYSFNDDEKVDKNLRNYQ